MLASIKQEAAEAAKEGAPSSHAQMKQRGLRRGRSSRLKRTQSPRRALVDQGTPSSSNQSVAASTVSTSSASTSSNSKRNPYTMSFDAPSRSGGIRSPRRRRASGGADVNLDPASPKRDNKVTPSHDSSNNANEEPVVQVVEKPARTSSPRRTQRATSTRRQRRTVDHNNSRRALLGKAALEETVQQNRRASMGSSLPMLALDEEERVLPEPRKQSRRASLDALGSSFKW